jgi:hypothetical protein
VLWFSITISKIKNKTKKKKEKEKLGFSIKEFTL